MIIENFAGICTGRHSRLFGNPVCCVVTACRVTEADQISFDRANDKAVYLLGAKRRQEVK
jgi:hypothetical protein